MSAENLLLTTLRAERSEAKRSEANEMIWYGF